MRPLTFQILRALSDTQFSSGAALATRFGVSRSAISDALMEASENGIEIFKLTRRGYKLAAPLDLLNLDNIRRYLGSQAARVNVDVLDSIESTNTELIRRAVAANVPSGSCIAAELQTAGRGRRGRQWQSGLGTSLTFSVLWRFDKGAAQLGGLSLVVGLAMAKALRKTGIKNAEVKWPNDIVVGYKKLGGILIETQGDMLGPTMAVIGIGINVALTDEMKNLIDQAVTDVASELVSELTSESAAMVTRDQLLAVLLGEMVAALEGFNAAGFKGFREEWLAHHAYQHKEVNVIDHGGAGGATFDANVIGVAEDGSLVVKHLSSNGVYRDVLLSSAEISVRAKNV